MSWHFSRALAEVCLQANFLDGEPLLPLNMVSIKENASCKDKMTEQLIHSQYGMTLELLTGARLKELLTLLREGSHAKPSARQRLEKTMLTTYGQRCGEWWQMSLPGLSMPRTFRQKQSTLLQMTCNRWVTKQKQLPLARKTWVATTFGTEIGFLHTPTTQGNYCADSMQKHKSCMAWRIVFGKVTPQAHEYLMGWPQGWSDCAPLEMDKFQLWLFAHSYFCANDQGLP